MSSQTSSSTSSMSKVRNVKRKVYELQGNYHIFNLHVIIKFIRINFSLLAKVPEGAPFYVGLTTIVGIGAGAVWQIIKERFCERSEQRTKKSLVKTRKLTGIDTYIYTSGNFKTMHVVPTAWIYLQNLLKTSARLFPIKLSTT
ncbi:hypothetical protein RhiirA4_461184 [Rhizophagus irregularis]|uniref:Uncharacterized protein n=1 Tax=Rhizophagus irregularis TaxID=588596 RepID=A0A2I1GI88_9GLOM|nr:hypothetical protein RhiirA4_461184 [Rhizophagus irregularis]